MAARGVARYLLGMASSDLAALVAAAPGGEAAIPGLLERAVGSLASAAGAESCECWLWRPTEGGDRQLVRLAGFGPPLPAEATGSDWIAASNAALDEAAPRASEAGSLEDANVSPDAGAMHLVVDGRRIQHLLLGAFGYAVFGWTHAAMPTPELLDRLRGELETLAEAIARRLPREELADASRWLVVRSELDRRVARSFANVGSLAELGRTIDDVCDQLFPVEYSGIYFLDPLTGMLRLVYAKGLSEAEREAAERTSMQRHPGVVIRTGVVIDSPEADLEAQVGPNAVPGHGRPVKSRLFLPVRAGGKVVGTIGFAASHRHAFNSRHRQALAFLAEFAGLTYARLAAQLATERRGKLLEATSAAVERLYATPDWRGAATAALAILGNALDAGALALLELAPSQPEREPLPLLEFLWQPLFGVPWAHGWRLMHASAEERSLLAADRALEIPVEGSRTRLVAKPVLVGGELWGVLVFEPRDESRPSLDRVERSAIRSLAAAFASAIARERLEATLRDRQKMEAVGRLASGIAHEFNGLLWPIVLYSEMLERTPDMDERSRGMLRDMQQAARRAGELVQQVLALARRRDRVLELVNVADVVGSVGQVAARMAPPGVEVHSAIDPEAGHILGDAGAFHEATMHLVTNALEAMQGRSGRVELEVDRQSAGGREWVRVCVRDQGPGIPESVRARLFDPYYASDPKRAATTVSQMRRHGLGLDVVRRVVAEIQGRIEVTSDVETGTAFELLLPVLRDDEGDGSVEIEFERPVPAVRAPAAGASVPTIADAPLAASPGQERILLADDDPAVLEVAEQMLRSLGYDVVPVRSGVDALVHLQDATQKLALLLTDLTMPGMDGIELAREARRLRPELPVVCCTGFGNERTERRAYEAGMAAFIRKPIDFERFAETVRSAIDGRMRRG